MPATEPRIPICDPPKAQKHQPRLAVDCDVSRSAEFGQQPMGEQLPRREEVVPVGPAALADRFLGFVAVSRESLWTG